MFGELGICTLEDFNNYLAEDEACLFFSSCKAEDPDFGEALGEAEDIEPKLEADDVAGEGALTGGTGACGGGLVSEFWVGDDCSAGIELDWGWALPGPKKK